jgi:SNF family Na+-dependent transporter
VLGAGYCVDPLPEPKVRFCTTGLDFFTANILLPLGGLLVAVFAGWVMSRQAMENELALSGSMFRL